MRSTPRPKAGRRRPADSRSRLASSLASTTGLRPGSTRTLVPNFSFWVRPGDPSNAYANKVLGEREWLQRALKGSRQGVGA